MSTGTRMTLEQLPERYREQALKQLRQPRERTNDAHSTPQDARSPVEPYHGKEKDLQRACEAFLRARGCIVFHMPGRAAIGNFRGWPDITALAPGGKLLLIELKSPRGKLSPLQTKFVERAARIGHIVHVCRSMAEVEHSYVATTNE